MSKETRDRTVRTWIGAIECGDLDGLDAVLTPDIVVHTPPYPDIIGREAYKRFVEETRAEGSEHKLTVRDLMCVGDKVVFRWEWRFQFWYANTVPHWGFPRTGRSITLEGLTMVRVADDKEVERWDYVDRLGFLQQLGVVPVAGAAHELTLAG